MDLPVDVGGLWLLVVLVAVLVLGRVMRGLLRLVLVVVAVFLMATGRVPSDWWAVPGLSSAAVSGLGAGVITAGLGMGLHSNP